MPLSDRDRRTLRIGGIVAGVLVVGLVLVNLLSGGGEEPIPRASRSPSPTTSPAPSVAPTPGGPPVAAFTGRDPFSVPGIFTSTSTSSGTSTSTSTSTSSGPPPSSPPTQPGNGSSTNKGGSTVTLIDISQVGGQTVVKVSVGSTVYEVTPGEDFGPDDEFRLQGVSGNCANFLYGDESFTLCVDAQK